MDFISSIPNFGAPALTILAFIVALSVIVFIHEYGHYIVGRWCGIHAEVFSLGFGPVLWSRKDRRGTRWQVAAIPLGGYVKFLGDENAASGTASDSLSGMSDAERQRTLHGADLWKRVLTVAAGPVFNFVLSILVFAAIFISVGTSIDRPVIGELKPLPGEEELFEPGDLIVSIDGQPTPDLERFFDVAREVPVSETVAYEVERDGQTLAFNSVYPFPAVLDQLQPRSAAMDAGLQVGDVIISVDGTAIFALEQIQDLAQAGAGAPMALEVWRNGDVLDVTLSPRLRDIPTDGDFDARWLIGFSGGLFFETPRAALGPVEAVSSAVGQTFFIAQSSISGLWHMITGAIGTCNLQGPIGIAKTSGDMASQGAMEFIWFIAVLSTAVGLLNLFPIPVLDGGHLVFHAYEAIRGAPPSENALRILMGGGLFLLLSLMSFALMMDVICP